MRLGVARLVMVFLSVFLLMVPFSCGNDELPVENVAAHNVPEKALGRWFAGTGDQVNQVLRIREAEYADESTKIHFDVKTENGEYPNPVFLPEENAYIDVDGVRLNWRLTVGQKEGLVRGFLSSERKLGKDITVIFDPMPNKSFTEATMYLGDNFPPQRLPKQ